MRQDKTHHAALIAHAWIKPGARIVVKDSYESATQGEKDAIGEHGTVIGYLDDFNDVQYFSQIPVEFDTSSKLRHSCRKLGKPRHCLYIPAMFLQQEAHHEGANQNVRHDRT